ncbi:hypothetical protein Vadar_018394 [Vaccinium darrowii]|uniref:Uncharacterized protein n=1 Tax=Vaccinium darrowii TaxID=229202 RepID=A0ACB7XRR6_9ERIC|nr:hypothetical protein Vadar_018394 [Vaccinium darrowii]
MSYSFKIYSSLLVSLLPLVLFTSPSFARPSMKPTSPLIDEICSKCLDPSLCLKVLRSNHHSAHADLKGLGRISIHIARKYANQTSNLITSLSKGETTFVLKGRYDVCAELYGDAIDELNGAEEILNKEEVLSPFDISTFRIRASAASDGPVTCEDGFEKPPNEPTMLKQANKKLEGLCSIVLAIGASLNSG